MMKKINLFFLFLVYFVSSKSLSQTIYEYTQNVKDVGRGGVHLLKNDDGSAFLFNPAILGFTSGVQWAVMNFQGGVNGTNSISLLQNYPIGPTTISHYYGQNIWIGFGGYSAFSMPYFGFGITGNSYLSFLTSNPAYTTIDISSITDYSFVFGTAFSFSDTLAMGVSFKRTNRTGGTAQLGPSDIATLNQTSIQSAISASGVGYGGDLGLLWRGKSSLNPTISLSWLNIGYTYFYPAAGTIGPPTQNDNLILNMTMNQNFAGFGWMFGVEYRHIRDIDIEVSKKMHVGTELQLGLLDVRAGFYQGWMGYGASIDLWLFNLDAAVYKVERGMYAGQTPDDRIEVALTIDAGFDPNFVFSGAGGKGRGRSKLKQRR